MRVVDAIDKLIDFAAEMAAKLEEMGQPLDVEEIVELLIDDAISRAWETIGNIDK